MIVPVIIPGGSEQCLWPVSRKALPKPFVPIPGPRTFIEEAARAFCGKLFDPPLVVSDDEQRFHVDRCLKASGIDLAGTLVQPANRNSAPAAAAAAHLLLLRDRNDDLLLIVPADHVIQDPAAFHQTIECVMPLAEDGSLIMFGAAPGALDAEARLVRTGPLKDAAAPGRELLEFVNAPAPAHAGGNGSPSEYFRNTGIFLFSARHYFDELERLVPDLAAAVRDAVDREGGNLSTGLVRLDGDAYRRAPALSIEEAVMERSKAAMVVPITSGWCDAADWAALWEIGDKDEAGNVVAGDVLLRDARNSYLRSDGPLVAAIGLEDAVVVATDDALFVASRERAPELDRLVGELAANCRAEYEHHPTVHRPWGTYRQICAGPRFQVKEITVYPGASLSLQYHHHRAEHWIIVEGVAEVVRNDETRLMKENETIFIPIGAKHRLTNPEKVLLRLIEVQLGSYLGEDDIVRLEDIYGRVANEDAGQTKVI